MEEEFSRKRFYRIGEVSRITGVRPHVLRYWEDRGKVLRPNRKLSRQRLYRVPDIQLILEIKRLVEEEKLTLPAVRRQLDQGPWSQRPRPLTPEKIPTEIIQLLQGIREELLALREMLD